MSKAYLFAVMLLFVPFTGCLETEESEPSLRESFDGLISAINADDLKKVCSYVLDYDGEFITGDEKEDCEYQSEEDQELYNEVERKLVANNYSAEKQDYKASESSGYVYVITIDYEDCWRENSTQSWECDNYYGYTMPWAKVDGRWGWGWEGFEGYYEDLEMRESAPIATFMVEENSGGFWQVDVIKVSNQMDLEGFSFFLKDGELASLVTGTLELLFGPVVHEHGTEIAGEGQHPEDQARLPGVQGALNHLLVGGLGERVVVGQLHGLLEAAEHGSHAQDDGEGEKESGAPEDEEPPALGPLEFLDGWRIGHFCTLTSVIADGKEPDGPLGEAP